MGKSKPRVDGECNVPGENCSRRFISPVTNDTLIAVASTAFLKAKFPIPSVERACNVNQKFIRVIALPAIYLVLVKRT